MPPLPLAGIRVIDITVVWAGPFGAALLSDLGAEVIRVESIQRWDANMRLPGNPEEMRKHGANVSADATPWETSANFNSVGRNHSSLTPRRRARSHAAMTSLRTFCARSSSPFRFHVR